MSYGKKTIAGNLFFIFCLFLVGNPADAQIFWTGGTAGNWNNPANWSIGAVPTDTADIFINTSVQITLDINPTIRSIEIDASGIDVAFLAGAGNTLIVDSNRDSTLSNDSGFFLDNGNLTIGSGVNLTVRNQRVHAFRQDTDTLTNYGNIYIEDYEAREGEGGDGMRIQTSAVFYNHGTVTVDDLDVVGAGTSYGIVLSGCEFHNIQGATLRIASDAMTSGSIARDAIIVNTASFYNDGMIHIGNENISSILRYGIYVYQSEFINNDSIYLSGMTGPGIYVDNPGADFTNNGGIHIINADDGIIVARDADNFLNAGNIIVGNGEPNTIDDIGIVFYGSFVNTGTIHIDGMRLQGILGYNEEAVFDNFGLITIENTGSEAIRVGNGNPGVFNNNGGTIQVAQNGGTIRGTAGLFVDNYGVFNNLNGGIFNIDFTNNDGIRCDPFATITNSGTGSEINLGLQGNIDTPTIGDGGNFDDCVINDGSIFISDGALFNIRNATGKGIRNNATGIFAIQSGAIVNIDDTRETAIYNTGNNGGKFVCEGANSQLNIGQISLIGTGNSDDYGIQNEGLFENKTGAIIRIDNIYDAEPFKNGNDTCCDSLINDGGHIFIAQNGISVFAEAAIHCRDSSVFHNLNGGTVLVGNVDNYGILMNPHSSLVNSGEITITDYESQTLGSDNGLMLMDASLDNNGTITINDPNNSGYILSHALRASNTVVNNGINGSINIIDNTMVAGKIGGSGIYFSDCTVTNDGAITVGQGNPAQIGANGVQWFNTSYSSGTTGMLEINGVPLNANAILLSSNSSIDNAGDIVINNTHRGINNSSAAQGIINSGSISIGNGNPDNITSHAIFNASDFGNSGTITINGTSDNGIRNGYPGMVFINEASGIIHIDNTVGNAFTNGIGTNNGCSTTNSGIINIGLNGTPGSIGKVGLINDDSGLLLNQNNGQITIKNTTGFALQNDAPGPLGIQNMDCSVIDIAGNLYNTANFLNAGILKMQEGVYTFSSNINNTGFIQDDAGAFIVVNQENGTVEGLLNTGLLATGFTADCGSTIENMLVSENPDISTAAFQPESTWFSDEAMTIPAGNFDAATNVFTFSNLPAGGAMNTLYFNVNGLNCSFAASIVLDIADNCPTCVEDLVIVANPSNFQLVEVINTITTSGAVIIETGKTVDFKAGMSILLNSDFEVQLGAEFDAFIGPCGTPSANDPVLENEE